MKNILIFLGGCSPEHEVSIITGLQVFEYIDRSLYNPIAIFVSEQGNFFKIGKIKNRKDFSLKSKKEIFFGYDEKGKMPYFFTNRFNKHFIYSAINTLHGGMGESGQIAGFFETYNIPHSSSGVESSVLCMNKALTKEKVSKELIPVVEGISFSSFEIKRKVKEISLEIQEKLGLPVIIKPVHLGSSIGIKIARNPVEVDLGLLEASNFDSEIMVEKYLENISEFNCSVRSINGNVLVSEIEKPLSKEELLSFSDKYEKGGKKITGGMASLSRELPAKISSELYQKIQDYSLQIFKICKCKGVVRIDFIMSEKGEIFFNEINPIPGSLAFYLWEVMGISFKQQISDLIENSLYEYKLSSQINYVHKTDIIKKFIRGYKN